MDDEGDDPPMAAWRVWVALAAAALLIWKGWMWMTT
jgi:hypothetical protein